MAGMGPTDIKSQSRGRLGLREEADDADGLNSYTV